MRLIPEMQVWLNIRKSINVIYLINRINEKSHKAISIHVKKHFISQNLTPFHDRKTLRKIGIKGKFLIMLKDIYEKLSANIILNGEKHKAFHLRSGTRQGCPLLPL